MPRRIAIFGPESTGKSMLAARLAAHYGEPWSPEYVRAYWHEHQGRIGPEDLDAIARGQAAAEDAAVAAARRVAFCDTELITCTLWDDLLFPGHCPAWLRAEAEKRARLFDLYLLCVTDQPFVPDPVRSFPDEAGRALCMRLWRDALIGRGLPYLEIHGGWDQRFADAVAAVDAVLAKAIPKTS